MLKEAQDLFRDCPFIAKKTRSIYAWRCAMWVRFCKEHKKDYSVTEDKLVNYLDWILEIDLPNIINTKKTFVPDILRDYVGSLISLWRFQNKNHAELVSPKDGTEYQAKWDEILRRFPRREQFIARPRTIEDRNTGMAVGRAAPLTPPHVHAAHQLSFSRSGGGGNRLYPHHPGHQQGMPPQRPLPAIAPYPHSQHSPQLYGHRPPTQPHNLRMQQQYRQQYQQQQPAGMVEPTEHCWQLEWILNGSWASATSRLLFTLAMTTWVEAANIVNMQLSDMHFASCTMSPQLPTSVLRISLVVPQASNAHHGPSGLGSASLSPRLQVR
ncbi:hypothetical protein IWW37_003270 [Coemansia sp. RSA 2050]|nr:hypothetical protein IWW37_003270 [Coemansia sp. RSA 2050]KAJ2733197.1 hypothetical protein IW152_003269 [Coemansia sp. BCRC 34962]